MTEPLPPKTTDDVLTFIVQTVKLRSHKLITRDTAKAIYEGIFQLAVEETKRIGYFKLPYGYGQFYLRVLGMGAKPRRLPTGGMVERKPKPVMRYLPGSVVKALLEGRTPGIPTRPVRRPKPKPKRRAPIPAI